MSRDIIFTSMAEVEREFSCLYAKLPKDICGY